MVSAISRMTSSVSEATHSPTEFSDAFGKLLEREWFQQLVDECIFSPAEPQIERFFEEYFAKIEEDSAFVPEEKIILKDMGSLWLYEIKLETGTADEAVDAFLAWHKFHEEQGLPNSLEMVQEAGRMRGMASWILGDPEKAAEILTEAAKDGDPLSLALLKAMGAPVPRFEPSFLNSSSTMGTWDNPEFKDALAFFYQGNYEAAIAQCEKMESESFAISAEMLIGYCRLMQGESEKALEVFEGRLSWDFFGGEASLGQALACRMLGLPAPGADHLSKKEQVIIRMISLI